MNLRTSLVLILALAVFPGIAAANNVRGDCDTAAACPETDVNCDDTTDGFDIAVVRAPGNWLMTSTDADEPRTDVNGDGLVDGFDIAAIRNPACWLRGGFTEAQLAGNSLGEYPFFEYVRAFNEDSTVEVAVDPGRFPAIVGETCDVYVVAAKTVAEWDADSSLVDMTAGGASTETFPGGTIQANTFAVTGAFELDADAGTGLGVGYDMVLDCDQDGELSGGDYIDGYGDEAGLYAVHDTVAPGPLAVTEVIYSGGAWLGQDLYYPTDIASMGQLPLVVISHGNGHNYQWYDHIGNHMASYGYVVMSHQNNTGPGIETASTTTLTNTDYIIANQATIDGGVLDGHLDSERITWIGHSRGGEGIARAYDRLFDGAWDPTDYDIEDIVLLSSMLPVDFLGPAGANPHGVNYHLWTASGDADVSGGPGSDVGKTFHLFERATGFRQSTAVQGTGHGDFHAASGSVFSGPCHIVPKSRVHDIQKGYFLPLISYYIKHNIPGKDFIWRQWEQFKPIGAAEGPACPESGGGDTVVVNHEFRQAEDSGSFIVDDYQTEPAIDRSSSGGSVMFSVTNVFEGLLRDTDGTFSWDPADPMNGMTRARTNDTSRGVVFDWNSPSFYEYAVIPSGSDWTQFEFFSLRGCQQTQHPNTVAELGDTTFTVTLRDGTGTTSSIGTGAYGGGFEEPYQRPNGGGLGWSNEIEVIRIRLTDFLNNGSGLDLSDVEAVRLEFGAGFGSDLGRIGLDAVEVTDELPPPLQGPIRMALADDIPEIVPPGVAFTINVEIVATGEAIVPGSPTLHYRYTGGAFATAALAPIGGDLFQATLPAPSCGDIPEFYFSAEGSVTGGITLPADAPTTTYSTIVGEFITIHSFDFETAPGWTVTSEALSEGEWEVDTPTPDCGRGDPPSDFDGSGMCFLTEQDPADCNSDVDGGPTRLLSPMLDITGASDPLLSYARWFTTDNDTLEVEISTDGTSWTLVESVGDSAGWSAPIFHIEDFVGAATSVQVRFTTSDNPNDSVTEGAIDQFRIFTQQCVE